MWLIKFCTWSFVKIYCSLNQEGFPCLYLVKCLQCKLSAVVEWGGNLSTIILPTWPGAFTLCLNTTNPKFWDRGQLFDVINHQPGLMKNNHATSYLVYTWDIHFEILFLMKLALYTVYQKSQHPLYFLNDSELSNTLWHSCKGIIKYFLTSWWSPHQLLSRGWWGYVKNISPPPYHNFVTPGKCLQILLFQGY